MEASTTVKPTSVEFDRGSLVVYYPGGLREVLEMNPPPLPRGARIRLSWDRSSGVVIDGAAPAGERFAFADQASARRLAAALRLYGPIEATVLAVAPPAETQRGTGDRGTRERATSRLDIDPAVFADPRPAGFLLDAAQRWAPRAPIPLKAPIVPEALKTFIESGDDARRLALTISVTWKEYVAAGGEEAEQYKSLAEALLVQAEFQNPSAEPGYLTVRRYPSGWGLYRHGVRWYNEFGLPIIGTSGLYWDRTYAPLGPPPFAVTLVIADPELFTLVTYLEQAMTGGQLELAAVAQGYLENGDLLLAAVLDDWDFLEELSEEILPLVGVLVAFLSLELGGRFLFTFGKGLLKVLGGLILVGVKVAGYAFNIAFRGEMALLAIAAGRELLLVRRRDDGSLDALSRRHLDAAAKAIRQLVIAMIGLKLLQGATLAGRPIKRAAGRRIKRVVAMVREALTPRPVLVPVWEGTYGAGPTYVQMGSRGQGGRERRESRPARGESVPLPRGTRPENWRELEKAVISEFHRDASPKSSTYITTRRHQLSTILAELQAHSARLVKAGFPDPLAKLDVRVLTKTRREVLEEGGPEGKALLAEALEWGKILRSRADAAEQVRNKTDDRTLKKKAAGIAKREIREYRRWIEFMNTKVGNQRMDLVEFHLKDRQVGVVDPSFAWRDTWHNLKSRIYLFSWNKVLGWEGGSAMDVGKGMFDSRIFFGRKATR